MSMVEKKKHLFVVTLDNGKKTYFDFVDHNIYGMSMKIGIIWMAIGAFITMYIITSSFVICSIMSAHTKICISRFA